MNERIYFAPGTMPEKILEITSIILPYKFIVASIHKFAFCSPITKSEASSRILQSVASELKTDFTRFLSVLQF